MTLFSFVIHLKLFQKRLKKSFIFESMVCVSGFLSSLEQLYIICITRLITVKFLFNCTKQEGFFKYLDHVLIFLQFVLCIGALSLAV